MSLDSFRDDLASTACALAAEGKGPEPPPEDRMAADMIWFPPDDSCVHETREQYLQRMEGHILDLGLPVMDGVSVLEAWRREGRTMPVLILTARDRWSDKVQGIDAGASRDDIEDHLQGHLGGKLTHSFFDHPMISSHGNNYSLP